MNFPSLRGDESKLMSHWSRVPFIKRICILPEGAAASYIKDIPNVPAASLLKGISILLEGAAAPLIKDICIFSNVPAAPFIKEICILPEGAAASFIKDTPNVLAASLLKEISIYWQERPPL